MATQRRYRTQKWSPKVETMEWKRSQPGTPKHRRSIRPALTHDAGWDWDGSRILFTEKAIVPSWVECDCKHREQQEDEHTGRIHEAMSLLDIVQYQVTKTHGKGRSDHDDFEIIRIPKVVPISENEAGPADGWPLDEWVKLDGLEFKRTYAEAVQGLVDGKGPPNAPNCSGLVPTTYPRGV